MMVLVFMALLVRIIVILSIVLVMVMLMLMVVVVIMMMLVLIIMFMLVVMMVFVVPMFVIMVMTVLRGRFPGLVGYQIHTTFGTATRLVLDNFRVHGADILDPGVQDRGVEILG